MKKADIETLELAGKVYPAVRISPDLPIIRSVSDEDFDKAWDTIQLTFWTELIPQLLIDIFGDQLGCFSAGKENEWLCVGDLAPVELWPALMVNKWRSLESRIRLTLDDITSPAYFLDVLKYELNVDIEGASGYRPNRRQIELEHDRYGEGPGRGKGYFGASELSTRQYLLECASKARGWRI